MPTITCPAGLSVSCANNVPAVASTSVITADNCGGTVLVVSLGDVITNQICPNRFTLTRTYRASDPCSNSATCSQTITVNDITPPSITCPANVSVSCASTVPPVATGSVTTSDLCGGTVSVVHLGDITTPGTCANRFSIARTYQATDLCGNSGTCAQTITVNDITPPSITCPANVTVSCASAVPPVATGSVTTSDLCGGTVSIVHLGDITTPGTCANRFSIARTYQATDVCGNSGTCAQTITVNDITPPSIICPVSLVVNCATNVPPPVAIGSVIASDLCGGAVTVLLLNSITTPGTCANRFSIARTYQATDLCGNSGTCAQIITVNDITAPIFTNVPANITAECFLVPAVPQNLTATDNCSGSATITFLGETQAPGICPIIYTLTRTWRADDGCGNSSTVTQLVQVRDTYAPQFVIMPANVVRECNQVTNLTDLDAWLDSHGGATVSDCSSITWTYQNSPFNLDTAGCGSTFTKYIRFIATDACGNSSFKDARFTVIDQTPPIFTILPQNVNIACWMGENGEPQLLDWLDNFGFAAVSDCGAVKTEIGLLSEVQGCSGTFTRTYQFRATDECGNTSYKTATFAIVDTTPPLITSCPQSYALLTCEFDIPGPDTVGVMAMDMCSDVTVTLQSTTINGIGCAYSPLTKTYTYAFTDACGNVSTCTQSFVVIDTIQPSYNGPDTLYVLCVADLPGVGDLDDVLAPYFVDNCYKNLCVGELLAGNDLNSITFNIYFKDLCANWADKDTVTFIANGGCKPLCSAPQDVWGNTGGLINGLGTAALIEQLINKHGALIAGKLNKTISVTSAACLQSMLPGSGNTNQFSPIHYAFTAANACNLSSPMLNSDGTLKHKLAANVFAMQLNIWYNAAFNDRNLGVQLLASVPAALIDPIILTKLEVQHFNVQGLLNLSNDYLAGVGFFPPNFGSPLTVHSKTSIITGKTVRQTPQYQAMLMLQVN